MSGFQTIPKILQIGQVCEYLATVDIAKNNILQSGDISENQARLIYMERVGIQNRYNLNPSDPTLQSTANYLLSICRYWVSRAIIIIGNLSGSKPVITGPANESATVGGSATFTVSVTSASPVVVQWLLNGVVIPGALGLTYTVSNAQLSQNGNFYSVTATNLAGQVTSNQATLTVTANLQGQWYAGNTDYSAALAAGTDNVVYSGTFSITDGQPLVVPFPAGQVDYIVVKYPNSQSVKTTYSNPTGGIDNGPVPGLPFNISSFGGNNYIFSRTGNPTGINNVNGRITFS